VTSLAAPDRLSMAPMTLRRLALRSALAGFVAGAAALAAGWAAQAQVAGFNSNAPVNYAADRIELQDRQNRVVLSGDVAVTQADLNLNAGRMTVAYSDAGGLSIQRIDATGGVRVARGNETARGDVAIYDFNRRVITMIGNVALRRGADTLNGGRLTIDLDSGVSSVDGRARGSSSALGNSSGRGGRVTGSFTVPKKN
jgi:lipopolysaccharide export system protein LptA